MSRYSLAQYLLYSFALSSRTPFAKSLFAPVRERRLRTEFANLVLRVFIREFRSRSKISQTRVPGILII